MKAQRDPAAAEALLEADLCYPDGVGAVWAAGRQGAVLPERVAGIDLAQRVLELAAQQGLSVYFLGGAEGVAAEAARRQTERLPGLRVAGVHHGYFPPAAEAEVVAGVREAKADILLVAMGAPRQEVLIQRHRRGLGVPVALGVGGTFDVWAGSVKRAPGWAQTGQSRVAPSSVDRSAPPAEAEGATAVRGSGDAGFGRRLWSSPPGAPGRTAAWQAGRGVLKYLISGYYGEKNVGDEAILAAILQEIERHDPEASFTVLTFDPDDTQWRHGAPGRSLESLTPSLRSPQNLRAALRASDLLISGGGGFLHEADFETHGRSFLLREGKLRPIPHFLSVVLMARAERVPVMWYAQGLGPLHTRMAKRLVALAGSASQVVTWRDRESAGLAYAAGVRSRTQMVVPDPAYAIEPAARRGGRRVAGICRAAQGGALSGRLSPLLGAPERLFAESGRSARDGAGRARPRGGVHLLPRGPGSPGVRGPSRAAGTVRPLIRAYPGGFARPAGRGPRRRGTGGRHAAAQRDPRRRGRNSGGGDRLRSQDPGLRRPRPDRRSGRSPSTNSSLDRLPPSSMRSRGLVTGGGRARPGPAA